jgi:HAD superfamily hydrolase (TIGR01509 family)
MAALIKAAIFDYGETLVLPKAPDQLVAPKAMLAAYGVFVRAGLKVTFEDFLATDMEVFGRWAQIEEKEDRDIPDVIKYNDLAKFLFPGRSEAWRRRVAGQANTWFWDVVAMNYSLAKGADRVLEDLRSMNIKMAVLSNHHSHKALVKHLKQVDLNRYFVRIFSSAQLGVRKPDRSAFEKCTSALRVRNDEAVFVGDSIRHDISGAKACGMKTVLIRKRAAGLSEQSGADFTVTKLEEIPRIIRRLNRSG